jgi:hypothetical protein
MKIKKLLSILIIGPLITMSGCATMSEPVATVEFKPKVNALTELRDISIEARHELRILAKLQESKHMESLSAEQHAQRHFQATYVPEGFDKIITFNYTGPASKTALALSKIAKYGIRVEGEEPAIEPWVRLNLKDQPLNEGFKEIGLQTGEKVKIEIHEPAKLIRFIYQ